MILVILLNLYSTAISRLTIATQTIISPELLQQADLP